MEDKALIASWLSDLRANAAAVLAAITGGKIRRESPSRIRQEAQRLFQAIAGRPGRIGMEAPALTHRWSGIGVK